MKIDPQQEDKMMKCWNTWRKEKMLKDDRDTNRLRTNNQPLWRALDLARHTVARRQCRNAFKILRADYFQTWILCPAKLSIKCEGRIRIFLGICLNSPPPPALQELLEEVPNPKWGCKPRKRKTWHPENRCNTRETKNKGERRSLWPTVQWAQRQAAKEGSEGPRRNFSKKTEMLDSQLGLNTLTGDLHSWISVLADKIKSTKHLKKEQNDND